MAKPNDRDPGAPPDGADVPEIDFGDAPGGAKAPAGTATPIPGRIPPIPQSGGYRNPYASGRQQAQPPQQQPPAGNPYQSWAPGQGNPYASQAPHSPSGGNPHQSWAPGQPNPYASQAPGQQVEGFDPGSATMGDATGASSMPGFAPGHVNPYAPQPPGAGSQTSWPPPGAASPPPPPAVMGSGTASVAYVPGSGSGGGYLPGTGSGSSGRLRTPPPDAANLQTGLVLDDKYQILVKLGQGGMGAVYRARHLLLQRDVALKVIAPQMAQDQNFRARFFREAKVAMEFMHRHAVPVRDFGVTQSGLYFMTMDFSTGKNLRQVVEQEGALPVERAVPIVQMILAAVAEAHRHHIVHRDLKPDNIMVEQQEGADFVKVLDFGLAKIAVGESNSVPSILTGGGIVGTPAYMAPEQARGEPVDPRADVYACGVILHELLTGRLPFQADSGPEMLGQVINTAPPPIRQVRPDLRFGEDLEDVVLRALAKDKNERFPDAATFYAALEPFTVTEKASQSSGTLINSPSGTKRGPLLQVGGPANALGATLSGSTHSPVGEDGSGSFTGQIIDRYKILSVLGEGGMGSVYKAEHQLMRRQVAFKVIKSNFAADPEVLGRFQREAQVSARFKHPSAIAVFDFGPIGNGAYFMAMELLNGYSLTKRIAVGNVPIRDTIEIACQMLRVLDASHKAGIVHRDLKPDNIMLQTANNWPNQVKVLDFGIAKILDDAPSTVQGEGGLVDPSQVHASKDEEGRFRTVAGAYCGTPQYSSPEQCKGQPVDARSDIYSMGIILLEMLTGKLPFESETASGFLVQHMVATPRRIREMKADLDVSPALEAVIMKALEKDRARRFQTAAEFEEALKAATGIYPIYEVGNQGVQLLKLGSPGASGKRIALIAACLALVTGAGVYFLTKSKIDTSHGDVQITVTQGSATVTLIPLTQGAGEKKQLTTKEDGTLDLRGLAAPAEYSLVFTKDGFQRHEQRIKLEGGSNVNLPVDLRASREGPRREAETARAAAIATRDSSQNAESEDLAVDDFKAAAKLLADADQAIEKEDFEVAKERYESAKRAYERAAGAAEKARDLAATVAGVVRQVDDARAAAEDAQAKDFAQKTLESATADEKAGREAAAQKDWQTARVRLSSAAALYKQATDFARSEQDRQVEDARADADDAALKADAQGAKELASAEYAGAAAKRDAAAAAAKVGTSAKKIEAIALYREAKAAFAATASAAQARQSASAFQKQAQQKLDEAAAVQVQMRAARDAADLADAAKLAPGPYGDAKKRDDLAARDEAGAKAQLAKSASDARATVVPLLDGVISRRREATLGYKDAEAAAKIAATRQKLIDLVATQKRNATAAREAADKAISDAIAKSADPAPAKAKLADADKARQDADALDAKAEAPGGTPDDLQRATEAYQAVASKLQEATFLAQAAASGGDISGTASGPKAAVDRLAANYKKALEARNIDQLRRCYIDFTDKVQTAWTKTFADSDKIEVKVESTSVSSDTDAEAVVAITYTINGRTADRPARIRLTLGRAGGAWKIAEVGKAP